MKTLETGEKIYGPSHPCAMETEQTNIGREDPVVNGLKIFTRQRSNLGRG